MKKYLLFATLIVAGSAGAQTNVIVEYEFGLLNPDTTKVVPAPVKSVLAAKGSMSYYYIDAFSANISNGQPIGSDFIEHSLYMNHAEKTVLESKAVNSRKFLVSEEMQSLQWELKDDFKRVVAGYDCNKAVTTIKGKKITAFYAPALPASLSPGLGSDLPGTILEVWFEGEARVLSAKKVIADRPVQITVPADIRVVDQQKFGRISSSAVWSNYTYEGIASVVTFSYNNILPVNANYRCTILPGISRPSNLPALDNCCLVPVQTVDIDRTLKPRFDPNTPRAKDGSPWVQ